MSRSILNLAAMWRYFLIVVLSASVSVLVYARVQPQKIPQGAQPFTPTRIDWLVTTLQANLCESELETNRFTLDIASPDSDTILIKEVVI
jgi:hypothetical protein